MLTILYLLYKVKVVYFFGFFYILFNLDIDIMNLLLQKMCMIRILERFVIKINDFKDIVEDYIVGLEMVSFIIIVYIY